MHATNLFTECVAKSCGLPDRLIPVRYQSASSNVTETASFGKCLKKCFSIGNIIIVSLNIEIPIIIIVQLPKVT